MFRIRDGTVEMKFSINNTNSRRADDLVGIELVTTHSHADAILLGLAWPHGADKVSIGDFAASGDFGGANEVYCFVAKNGGSGGARFGDALSTATPFVGLRCGPNVFVGATEKGVNGLSTTGGGIVHFSGDGRVVLDGLCKVEDLSRGSLARRTSEWSAGLCVHPRRWYGSFCVWHPRK